MNIYKPETIKRGIRIRQYLEDQGIKTQGNRAAATWRDGKRMSVSITENEDGDLWHDFVAEEGGDIIALYLKIEGGSFIGACRELGDRYHLTPDKTSRKPKKIGRGEMLAADGFRRTACYEYKNADGTPRYWVDRYERIGDGGKKEKEFVQRGPDAENLSGIEKTIYNLPAVIAAARVFVVEGEKDADTLTRLGLTATTNSGGAKNWCASFNHYFDGKEVVILPDNDEPGAKHGEILAGAVAPFAKSVKVVGLSKLPKGDVTDWLELEGGSLSALIEAVNAAAPFRASKATEELSAAKMANENPLLNYEPEWTEDENGKPKLIKHPRRVDDICGDMATRFLGFPKRIGGVLFDYTRGNPRRIESILNHDALRAWINGTSGHQSDFATGGAFASYKEVMERLLQTRPRYDVIARAPWYPVRDDAFAAYETLPTPDAARTKLDELMAFFLPATDADATLMRAFFFAPMYHTEAVRPAWIVDTVDAQASGKTTVVKACGWIYNEQPLKFDLQQLGFDTSKIKREILSSDGREKRMVLFDNVTSSIKSGALADFVTSQSITGMAPYGRSVETRANDITWCATVNGASVDTDMATRSYVIHIKAPGENADPMWEKRLRDFIETNRPQILADIMDSLRAAVPRCRKRSRFGEFDAVVLSAAAKTDAEFAAADEAIRAASEAANDDSDLAAQCVEAITDALVAYDTPDGKTAVRPDLPCVLKCSDVDEILRHTSGGVRNWTSKTVRRFVNGGHIPNIVKGVERLKGRGAKEYFGNSRCFVFAAHVGVLRDAKRGQFVVFDGRVPSVLGVADI